MMYSPHMTRAHFRLYTWRRNRVLRWRRRITAAAGLAALAILAATSFPW